MNPENLKDEGDRSNSKISNSPTPKDQDSKEIEVLDRQLAPKVSVKVERKINLGDYNNVTIQAFLSSGTIEHMRGDITDSDGQLREDVQQELASIADDLETIATGRVVEAGKQHKRMEKIGE